MPQIRIIQDDSLLDHQEALVQSALSYINQAAIKREEQQQLSQNPWNIPNPEEEAAREVALADMMGLNDELTTVFSSMRDMSTARARRSRDLIEAVRGCTSLECLRVAHTRPPGPATFNFPHFLFIGWQKTATTALFNHLNKHPQIIKPWDKEPEFFSSRCGYRIPDGCPMDATEDYIRRVLRVHRYSGHDGQLAAYDASTHYSRNGQLMAQDVSLMMPWVKVIATLREPISRAASMLVHLKEKNINGGGCLQKESLVTCLKAASQIHGDEWGGPTNYSTPLRAWLTDFPSTQVHVIQYENLIDSVMEKKELKKMKRFIGVDVNQPDSGLGAKAEYRTFPMTRDEYQELIDMVKPDCEAVASLIDQYEKGKGSAWMMNWERVWEGNLATCDEDNRCDIKIRVDD